MNCRVCNSDNNPKIKNKIYKCKECGHTFINYSNDGVFYHKELYRAKGQEGSRGRGELEKGVFTEAFHKRRDSICNRRIDLIKDLIASSESLLDIGAGGGTFLNKVKNKVKTVEATEVSDVCASNLKNYGYKTYHGAFNDLCINKQYDLVTCWHVLEHIEDIQKFVSKVLEVTKNKLVLEVPINRTLRNPDKNFDGHFHYFTEKSMRILFEDYFNIDYIGPGVQMPCLLVILSKKV